MIEIIQGSILDFDGDTIVNPANNFLRHGAGLARVIANAAVGEDSDVKAKWWEEQFVHPSIATGDAGWTSAGLLPYKGIVHAVGPIWKNGDLYEEDLLAAAHFNSLKVAAEHECKSIAFPAISCGLFRFPIDRAAPIAINVVNIMNGFERIAFYLFEDAHYEAYIQAYQALDVTTT